MPKPTNKQILKWTIIVLLAAIVAAYVLFCAFCLLCGWLGNDFKLFGLGLGGFNLPLVIAYVIGK